MDNQISFPYNYEAYLNKGMAAWQTGNPSLAAEYFQKALSIHPGEEVLLFYLLVLPETEMGREAVAFLRQKVPRLWYSRTLQESDRLFIELLLQAGQLEEARLQLENRQHLTDNAQREQLLLLTNRLQQLQERRFEEKKRLYHQLLKEREDARKSGFLVMNAFLRSCKQLTDTDYASLCSPLLSDEHVHPLHKTEILEDLLNRDLHERYLVVKGSFRKLIHPASLLPVMETRFFQAGRHLLQENREGSEEGRRGLEQNLLLHTAYYYPFQEEAFSSAEAWLATVAALQQPDNLLPARSTPVRDRIQEVERAMNELAGL